MNREHFRAFYVSVVLVILASCAAPQSPPLPTFVPSSRHAQVDLRRASSGSYCLTAPCLYVSTVYGTPAIVLYRLNQRGRSKPDASIRGGKTTLVSPESIAVDARHNVYVANVNDYYQSSILVYPAGSYGNVAPVRTIAGSHTKMGILTGIAVDSAGKIYVTNFFSGSGCVGSVTIYAAGANGDSAPLADIKGSKAGLCNPRDVAVDSAGDAYVTIENQADSAVNVYAAGANGNVSPMSTISGSRTMIYDPEGIALDSAGNIFVADTPQGPLLEFRRGASGDATPVRAIAGVRSKLQTVTGIAADPGGKIYTNNQAEDNILVFSKRADGDVAPTRMISLRRRFPSPTAITIR